MTSAGKYWRYLMTSAGRCRRYLMTSAGRSQRYLMTSAGRCSCSGVQLWLTPDLCEEADIGRDIGQYWLVELAILVFSTHLKPM